MQNGITMARRVRLLGGAALIGLIASTATTPATAQTAPATPSPAPTVAAADSSAEEIVVTGSRLSAAGFSAPTPVAVIGAEDIKLSGTVNVERLLAESPQFVA